MQCTPPVSARKTSPPRVMRILPPTVPRVTRNTCERTTAPVQDVAPGLPRSAMSSARPRASSRARTRLFISFRRQAVFSRLGTWCHDHRKLVLGLWVGRAPPRQRHRPAPSATPSATSSTCPTSSPKTGFDILDDHFGGQGTGIIGTIVFQADQGVDDPEVQAPMQDAVRRGRRARRRGPGREPLRARAASSRSRPRATEAGQDRLRQRRAARRHRVPPGRARSATRSSTTSPDIDGLRVELGGFIFAEFEEPSSEALGLGLRHRHPDRRLRLGAGHGPAGRRRAVRHRHRHRASSRCSATSARSPTSPPSSAS